MSDTDYTVYYHLMGENHLIGRYGTERAAKKAANDSGWAVVEIHHGGKVIQKKVNTGRWGAWPKRVP